MNDNFYCLLKNTVGESNVLKDEPMSLHTTFRIGGNADYFVTPENIEQIIDIIKICNESKVDYTILGNGSNVLVSDKGIRGVVIQLQRELNAIKTDGVQIYALAGALLSKIAAAAFNSGLTGFEFAAGIPGSLGGAVLMNAGAYGGEMRDVIVYVDVYKPSEGVVRLNKEELKLGYRTSIVKHTDWIVLGACIELKKGDRDEIAKKMEFLKSQRNLKQPVDMPSAGSAFKRPQGYFAGKLIMDAGLRGFSIGGAAVSEKHCGFLVNKGGATADDMLKLFNEVKRIVREKFGVTLEPEVRFIGEF